MSSIVNLVGFPWLSLFLNLPSGKSVKLYFFLWDKGMFIKCLPGSTLGKFSEVSSTTTAVIG